MGIIDRLRDVSVSGALSYTGLSKKRKKAEYGFTQPSEVNAIPVIYGRPGWVEAIPVAIYSNLSGARYTLSVHYVLSEGLQRFPDALKVNEYLDEFSPRYIRSTQAEQDAALAAIADQASGSWSAGYGQKIIYYVDYRTGFPIGADIEGEYKYCGCSLLVVSYVFNSTAAAYISDGSIPSLFVLANGAALHDPRIDPDSFADNYVYAPPADRAVQVPRWSLGGVAKRWRAANISNASIIQPASDSYGYVVGGTDRERRLGDDPDTNPALVVMDYLTAPIYGAGIDVADINLPTLMAEASYCDADAPTYAGGPVQAQMSCDISLDTGDKIRGNLEKILQTCRGGLCWLDGQYHLHIRKAGQSVAYAIEPDQILKRSKLNYGKKSDRINRIIATYTDSANQYKQRQIVWPDPNSATFNSWLSADGELLEKEVTLDGVNNVFRAADLISTIVLESRAQITAEYECSLELLAVTAGDLVTITDDKFTAKLFWVERAVVSFSRRRVVLSLREQNESAYDNLLHPVDITPAGTSALPDSTAITAVSGLQFAAVATIDTQTAGTLSWTASPDYRVASYLVQIIRSGDSAPLYTLPVAAESPSVALPYLPPGDYVVSVSCLAGALRSASAQLGITIAYADMPLPAVTGLRLAGGGAEYAADAVFEIDPAEPEAEWFAAYEWRVYAGAELLRTRSTATPSYVYTLADNVADGSNRTIRVNCRRKAISGQYGAAAELEVSKPAPAAPAGIVATPGVAMISLRWLSDYDVAVYVGTQQGFTPDAASRRYYGRAGAVVLNDLAAATTYYLQLQAFDDFGAGSLSGELQLSTLADPVPGIISQLDRLDGDVSTPGSVLQLVDTERQQRELNEGFNAALQAVLSRAHDAQRAAVQSFEVVRATTTEALTQQVTLAVSRIDDNQAAIYSESLTRATETGSLASQVALLQAKVDARPVFSSGWEPGLDYDRWTVSTGTLVPETTDVFTGLQSGLLDGTISAPVSSGTADGFSGRDVRLVIQVKAAPGTALDVSYTVGSYSSGWQPITVTAEWAEQAITLTVPAETAGNAGTISIRTTAGSVLVDRLILENADSDLPVITAEIERISNAQANLEGAVASELATLETQFNDSLALVQQTAESKVSETEALAIANSAIQAKGYDTTLAGIVSEQSALANEQTAQSTRLDALAAGTGLGETGISERGVSLATDIQLSSIVENVISAASKTGAAAFTSLKEVVVTKDAARAISQEQQAVQLNDLAADYTEYKRSAIGYCVDANGNPTNHADAVSCELVLGNRWITAPLAEALTQARITLPGGETAQAGLLLQSLSDGVEQLTARAALAIDVNGRVSGLFLEGSETASALDIVVDSFRIKTAGGSKTPFEVVGDEVRLVDAIVSGIIDIQGVASFGGVKIGGPVPIIELTDSNGDQVGVIGYEAKATIPGQKDPTRLIELGGSSWTSGLVYLECNNAAGDQFAAIELVTNNGRAINTDGSIVTSGPMSAGSVSAPTMQSGEITKRATDQFLQFFSDANEPQLRLSMGLSTQEYTFPTAVANGAVFCSPQVFGKALPGGTPPVLQNGCFAIYLNGAWRVIQTTGSYAPGAPLPA